MKLVPQGAPRAARAPAPDPKKVVVLVFDGVEIIDFTGPWEVFGAAGFDVAAVGETKEPVTTSMGMRVVPRYTFTDAPRADVVVVPGGSVQAAKTDAAVLRWVKEATARAEHTLSVCNGAFILANAGLLDGLAATTTAHHIDTLATEFPKTRVVSDERFVDSGKIITAAGLSAGIDGALHVVAVMMGNGAAQADALALEYDWRPQGGFVRAALADRLFPDVGLDELGTWKIDRTEGGTDHWDIVALGSSTLGAAALEDRVGAKLASSGWVRTSTPSHGAVALFKFVDPSGKPWKGSFSVEGVPGDGKQYLVKGSLQRAE